MASFDNRQGGVPEFQKFVKLNLKFFYIIRFLRILHCHWKRTASIRVFVETGMFLLHVLTENA
jgi:hypothetical protein